MFGDALREFDNFVAEKLHKPSNTVLAAENLTGELISEADSSLDAEKRKLAVKLYNDKNYSVNQMCQIMGISKPTLYKYVRAS